MADRVPQETARPSRVCGPMERRALRRFARARRSVRPMFGGFADRHLADVAVEGVVHRRDNFLDRNATGAVGVTGPAGLDDDLAVQRGGAAFQHDPRVAADVAE